MRLGITGGLGRKRMWANGIGKEKGSCWGNCVASFVFLYRQQQGICLFLYLMLDTSCIFFSKN